MTLYDHLGWTMLFGEQVVPDTWLVPFGEVWRFGGKLHVGVGTRNQTEAILIVRKGMADTLAWLGQPVIPFTLRIALRHHKLGEEM